MVVNKLHLLCGERASSTICERINVVIFMDFILEMENKVYVETKPYPESCDYVVECKQK